MNLAKSNSQLNDKENITEDAEWPGYKAGSLLGESVPLLIMELHRLQPYYEDYMPQVHVLNMPHVKIRRVEIVGIIQRIYARSRLDISVDDGTGRAQVLYTYEDIELVKKEREQIDAKFSRLEKIAKLKNLGSQRMKELEKQWKQETGNGTLGRPLKVLEYVHVIGKIHLDFGFSNASKKDCTVEGAKLGKPVIFAKKICHLTEKEYNDKIQTWISGVVKERYQKD